MPFWHSPYGRRCFAPTFKFVSDEFVEPLRGSHLLAQPLNKKGTHKGAFVCLAVGQGFEPREPLGSTVFKTAAFDHSASPPERRELYRDKDVVQ